MIRLLIWSLIWISSTSIEPTHPLVLFPDHVEKYPHFSNAYAQKHGIKSITIFTSKKFPDRPIYKFGQYEVLKFSTDYKFIERQTIFESLSDTLETVISWQGRDYPTRIFENTGAQWEYGIWQWKDGLPLRVDYDFYENRDARASEALLYVGNRILETTYWQQDVKGQVLTLVQHNGLGTEKGRIAINPYHRPKQFIATSVSNRRTFNYNYELAEDGRIERIQSGGRLSKQDYLFKYNENGSIKQVKVYRFDELFELVDYFYGSNGTLRSILITNPQSKEMTIKEFRYSFY
ncbi:hypothetical protein [Luteibaculum oceani]|uniref:Uncharacterized protein n=1 Tax=Luteibaculum oceani TaxID=1294296 RepID=A0A5C6URK0_9FLAO|nr:hypothetical protein [Luteibaculum oceani]TXC75629.1 hypothetical protein FRX97_11665 [Luteibaculum oceani]